ncbi:hypothetical protein GBAR_LOCUS4581 [Geodia barretti]|uniref:Uncharacterized protein n=1 Tax=Geodia barretti TaxID=519541 RepID=A0AA35W8V5_GEOBA|nr:hypothetical protein GBAR_LOCUS4581 [Geodia barretti]
MREAIHALRCIFWCLRSTQSTGSIRLCFATEQFQRKPFEISDLHCPFSRWYPL